jgi:beta-lactamase regulating signal transducer with metallopeptidase domain
MISEITNRIAEVVSTYGYGVLLAAWRALPLLLVAMAAGLLLRKRLAPKYHAILWSLVVIRMLMPVSIGSPWSIHGAIDNTAAKLLEDGSPPRDLTPREVHVDDRTYYFTDDLKPTWQPSPNPIAQSHPFNWVGLVITMSLSSVVIITAGLIVRGIVAHVRFARRLARCESIDDRSVAALLNSECNSLGISRTPQLKEVPGLPSPAMFGLLRSTICLPANFMETVSQQELRWILRHELSHIRRWDTWIMTLAMLAQSFHWLNPLAWLTTAKLRANIEAAADEVAIGSGSTADAAAYGHLLIRIAESSSGHRLTPALGLLPLAAERSLKNRIERLAGDHSSSPKWIAWLFALSVMFVITLALTDQAKISAATQVDEFFSAAMLEGYRPPVLDVSTAWHGESQETHLEKYDVTPVLEKIRHTPFWNGSTVGFVEAFRSMFPSKDLQMQDDTLLANLTDDQHARLSRMLKEWQANGPQQISVEFRIIHTNLEVASNVDWFKNRIENVEHQGSQPFLAAKLSDNQMRVFMADVQSDQKSQITHAPKITLFNAQTGDLVDGVQKFFVVGVEPIVGETDTALEPIIEAKNIGLSASFSPVVRNKDVVELTFDVQTTTIVDERLAKLPHRNPGSETSYATVQVPSLATTSVKSTLELAPAETIVIAAPQAFKDAQSDDSEKTTIYAITPRILDLN